MMVLVEDTANMVKVVSTRLARLTRLTRLTVLWLLENVHLPGPVGDQPSLLRTIR